MKTNVVHISVQRSISILVNLNFIWWDLVDESEHRFSTVLSKMTDSALKPLLLTTPSTLSNVNKL